MASFFPIKGTAAFRIKIGTHPETNRDLVRTVSITRVDPAVTPANLKAVADLLEPMLDAPLIDVRLNRSYEVMA